MFSSFELQQLCSKYHLTPSRRYGQNFLINKEPIEKMIAAAEISKDDVVVEVGPGFGGLTFALAEKADRVIAVEIEKKLMGYWEGEMRDSKFETCLPTGKIRNSKSGPPSPCGATAWRRNIEIVWGNVLSEITKSKFQISNKCPISNIQYLPPEGGIPPSGGTISDPYKVVANLPYQITSAVIKMFLEMENKPEMMVLMVQKEVAERICAKPGEMSVLAVAVQYYAEAEIVGFVSRKDFWPEPEVDSAIVKLMIKKERNSKLETRNSKLETRNSKLEIRNSDGETSCSNFGFRISDFEQLFFRIVKAGFANKRKVLINNLRVVVDKKHTDELKMVFALMGLKETVRAQELSVEQWKDLTSKLSTFL